MPTNHTDLAEDFGELSRAVLDLVDRAGAVPAVTATSEPWSRVIDVSTRLADRRFLIAVCGEFSSGKSTLLGALLRRAALFPDDVGATTTVATVVVWGPKETIVVTTRDKPDGVAVAAVDLPRYVTQAGNPDNTLGVLAVTITLPDPLLAEGIGFVDLPGLGSLNAAHATITNSYLEQIDAALFVSEAQTVSQTEVDFFARVSDRVGDALVIARSKVDLLVDAGAVEKSVADMRDKAANRLGVAGDQLVIVPVTALAFSAALGDPEEERASKVPELAEAIDTAITARAGSLLARAVLDALDIALAGPRESIELRLAVLTQGRTEEILTIQHDLEQRRAALGEVVDRAPTWRKDLDTELAAIGTDAVHSVNGGLRKIRSKALSQLEDSDADVDANAFTSHVINSVHDLCAAAHRDLERRVNKTLIALAGEIGLDVVLDPVHADVGFRGTKASTFVEPKPTTYRSKAAKYAEAGSRALRKNSGWRIAGAIGGFLAGVALAPVTGGMSLLWGLTAAGAGATAANAAAAATTWSDELREIERVDPEKRRRKLRQHVIDALEPNHTEAADRIKKTVDALRTNAHTTLNSALSTAKSEVTERIESLTSDLRRSREDAAAEAGRLRPVLTEIEDLIEETARLGEAVEATSGRLSGWKTSTETTDETGQGIDDNEYD